jgi:hypothetical protein
MEFPSITTDLDPNHDDAFWVLVIAWFGIVFAAFVVGALVRWGWRWWRK